MKKYFCCSILLLFSINILFAQSDIYGRVVDEDTNTPIENASIFFNNTTISTSSDINGEFHFESVRMFNSEFVIYAPSYRLLIFKTTPKEVEGKKIVFKLQKDEVIPAEKKALLINQKDFQKQLFKESLLGITSEASNCQIKNQADIYFVKNDQRFLSVTAAKPLLIINEMLGYQITYYMNECIYDDSLMEYSLNGYASYKELEGTKKVIKNREKNYYGSTLHFFRSLINRKLFENDFGIALYSNEKDTAVIYGTKDMMAPLVAMMRPVAEHEILSIDDKTNELSINIGNKQLLVQYNKDPYLKDYLLTNGSYRDFLAKGVNSSIIFTESPMGIKYPGVLDDYSSVLFGGYWSFEKLANKLPFDYELPKHYR